MVKLKQIQFLLFVASMTSPVHAIDVILSNARSDFKQKYEINTRINITNGEKKYNGTLNQFTFWAQPGTSKVIVHISSKSRFVEIMRPAVREIRLQIAQELNQWHCEIVFLGIEDFDDNDYHLISAFIGDKISFHPNQRFVVIETIGVNRFDHSYSHVNSNCVVNFEKYQENAYIFGGTLLARLKFIPHGTLQPVGRNNKKIKFYEYMPILREATLSVGVVNNTYIPDVSASGAKYMFKDNHSIGKIHLVILSGRKYAAATGIAKYSKKMSQIRGMLKEMRSMDDVMVILGAFNFDWTEVDIVTQIILQHSDGWQNSDHNVFVYGFGIFNTLFSYVYENNRRFLLQEPNSNVVEIMKVLIEEEVNGRSIDVYDFGNEWEILQMPISLSNGRYIPEERFQHFSFQWPNQKIAFIVYDPTEIMYQIDYATVGQSVNELKWSGIDVIFIEAKNFGRYDVHIIAEWVDYHRRNISPEQIAILGAGIFDTIFQSELTTYNTFLNRKNELQTIRDAYVKSTDGKYVFTAKIDDNPNFEVWSYSINTVNGFYEPDMISDENMFDTRGGRKIFFIITSASILLEVSTVSTKYVEILSSFRRSIENHYPLSNWSVYLVGLHNFVERDSRLFAELVNAHTHDERSLNEFVRTFNYGTGQVVYQYKDVAPFGTEYVSQMISFIASFFETTHDLRRGIDD